MGTSLSRIAALLMVAATSAGCGSDGGSGIEKSVLTTVEVTPATATLFTVAPGNAVTLTVVAKDQNGHTMVGTPSFSSDNAAIADVSIGGTVTAVAAGTARITASLTIDGVTKNGTTTVTAQVAPANATVVAPATVFQPATVDVQAGGTVTWTFGSTGHQVTFITPGAPADIPEFQNGSVSRTFPNNGTFYYQCSGPQMSGVVRVH
jgi:plastocyanin